jgi:hypothetical protein
MVPGKEGENGNDNDSSSESSSIPIVVLTAIENEVKEDYAFKLPVTRIKELVDKSRPHAVDEGVRCLQGDYMRDFEQGVFDREHVEVKLIANHALLYVSRLRKSTKFMRINAYCKSCTKDKNKKAKYVITIDSSPLDESYTDEYVVVNVSRIFDHFHEQPIVTTPIKRTRSRRKKVSANGTQLTADCSTPANQDITMNSSNNQTDNHNNDLRDFALNCGSDLAFINQNSDFLLEPVVCEVNTLNTSVAAHNNHTLNNQNNNHNNSMNNNNLKHDENVVLFDKKNNDDILSRFKGNKRKNNNNFNYIVDF